MLGVILAAALAPQVPAVEATRLADWQSQGGDPARPQAVVVIGEIELSAADAFDGALEQARATVGERLRQRGDRWAREAAPMWMPAFLRQRVVDDWLRRLTTRELVQVLDRRTDVRQYSYGDSYQTALLVQPDPAVLGDAAGWFRRHTRGVAEEFLLKCGGIGGLWGLLAVVSFWLDRLTRGYMTWRLRIVGAALAAVGTGVVFLL